MKAFIVLYTLVLLVTAELSKASSSEENIEDVLRTRRTQKPKTTTRRTTTRRTTTRRTTSRTPSTTHSTTPSTTTSIPDTTARIYEVIFVRPECLPDETSITIDDLKFLIEDEIKNNNEAVKERNEVITKEVKEVVVKHTTELKDFLYQFSDRPKHLEHVLKIIKDKRQTLELMIKELNEAIRKNHNVFEAFKHVEEKAKKLHRSFSICENLCDNCRKQSFLELSKTDTQAVKGLKRPIIQFGNEEFYCGKITDIKKRIAISIGSTLHESENKARQIIQSYDEKIRLRLQLIKEDLKSSAFKEYNYATYGIVTLLYKYNHLKSDVAEISPINDIIRNLKRNITEVEHIIYYTNEEIQRTQKKCILDCSMDVMRYGKTWDLAIDEEYDKENDEKDDEEEEDLLDVLIKQYAKHMFYAGNLESLFEKVLLNLHDFSHIEKLEPSAREVQETINKELNILQQLRDSIPVNTIADIKFMLKSTNKIKIEVEEVAEKLKALN